MPAQMVKCKCGHWDQVHQRVFRDGEPADGCVGRYRIIPGADWHDALCECRGFEMPTDGELLVMTMMDG